MKTEIGKRMYINCAENNVRGIILQEKKFIKNGEQIILIMHN